MVQTPWFVANQPVLREFWGLTLEKRGFGLQTPCFAQTLSFVQNRGFGGCWDKIPNFTNFQRRSENNFKDVLAFSKIESIYNPGGHLKKCRSPGQEKCRGNLNRYTKRPLQDSAIIFSTPGWGNLRFYCANHRVSCKCQQPPGRKIHRFFRWKMPFAVFRSGSGVSESAEEVLRKVPVRKGVPRKVPRKCSGGLEAAWLRG